MNTLSEYSPCPFCQTAVSATVATCPRCQFPTGGTDAEKNIFNLKWKEIEIQYKRLEARIKSGQSGLRIVALMSGISFLLALFRLSAAELASLPTSGYIWFGIKLVTALVFSLFAFVLVKRAPKPVYVISILLILVLLVWQLFQVFGAEGATGYFGFIVMPVCVWFSLRAYFASDKFDHVSAQYHELQRLRTGKDPDGV